MFPIQQTKAPTEREIRVTLPNFVIKAACKRYILGHARATRFHRFTRLDLGVYDELNLAVRSHMKSIAALSSFKSMSGSAAEAGTLNFLNKKACKRFILERVETLAQIRAFDRAQAAIYGELNRRLVKMMESVVVRQPSKGRAITQFGACSGHPRRPSSNRNWAWRRSKLALWSPS